MGFSKHGVDATENDYYFELGKTAGPQQGNRSGKLDLKLTELWVSGSPNCSIVAGLTYIPTDRVLMISPSGSNWSGSSGVG